MRLDLRTGFWHRPDFRTATIGFEEAGVRQASANRDKGEKMGMRQRRIWALLLLTLFVSPFAIARGADDDDEDKPASKSKPGWFARMFGGKAKKEKPAAKKARKKKKKAEADDHLTRKPAGAADGTGPDKPTLKDHMAKIRARAEDNYLRRVEVVTRLRQIALARQDDKLLEEAKQLDIRVWEAYQRHLNLDRGESPFESDQQILDEHLGKPVDQEAAARMLMDATRKIEEAKAARATTPVKKTEEVDEAARILAETLREHPMVPAPREENR